MKLVLTQAEILSIVQNNLSVDQHRLVGEEPNVKFFIANSKMRMVGEGIELPEIEAHISRPQG